MRRLAIQNKTAYIVFFIFSIIVLSACSLIGRGGGDQITVFGDQNNLTDNATLVCSQECSDRGFCGQRDTGERTILLNTQAPSTQTYDLLMANNTPVTIMVVQPRTAILQVNQTAIGVNYYLVSDANLAQGWVAGWCIGQ